MTERARDWRYDAIVLVGIGALLTVLFATTPLDIVASRLFYSPEPTDHWPVAKQVPWSLLYRSATWITASLLLAGLAGLVMSLVRRDGAARRHSVFILLAVAIGPGLLVNAICKDHWDRPRPRDIVQFGGASHYVVAPLPGEGGSSFPCGHCSVAFLYGAGWWIWRRRRPHLAALSLVAGVVAGVAMGICRMAAGAHFLSDVLWSGLLVAAVVHVLYHYVLRIPVKEALDPAAPLEPAPVGRRRWLLPALAGLGGLLALTALVATPQSIQVADETSLWPVTPQVLEVTAQAANVEIVLVDSPAGRAEASGELHCFGLPTSRLRARAWLDRSPIPTLRYAIEQGGWLTTALDGAVSIRMPASKLQRVIVRLERGTIKVTDATQAGVVDSGKLRLDLHTASGHVLKSREAALLE
jgi:membrane-associated PAP2 superfamily phosphatase